MSVAGGMPEAVARAVSVAATALQVFVKSPSQWTARPFAEGEAATFRRALREAGLEDATIAHASYLINLASADETLWQRSIEALAVEIDRCAALGIEAIVVHPGSPKEAGEEAGIARVAKALERVYRSRPGRSNSRRGVATLLEVTAGQGRSLGARFEELGEIIHRCPAEDRLGVCFDTCHAFAAGYALTDRRDYEATFGELDRHVGLGRLRAIHLNDSRAAFGSRRDRHEHVGRGQLGLEAFRHVVNDPRFRALPMVLETEKGHDLAEDRMNLAVLRGLVKDR